MRNDGASLRPRDFGRAFVSVDCRRALATRDVLRRAGSTRLVLLRRAPCALLDRARDIFFPGHIFFVMTNEKKQNMSDDTLLRQIALSLVALFHDDIDTFMRAAKKIEEYLREDTIDVCTYRSKRAAIVQLLKTGKRVTDIARKLDTTTSYVTQVRIKSGIPPKHPLAPAESAARAERMVAMAKTYHQSRHSAVTSSPISEIGPVPMRDGRADDRRQAFPP